MSDSEYYVVRGGRLANQRAVDVDEQLRRDARADLERRAIPPATPPHSDGMMFERLRQEKVAAESGAGAAREATEAERQDRATPVSDVMALTRAVANRAAAVLRLVAAGTTDSLRNDLRLAIGHRDSAAAVHREAEAELARARQAVMDAVVELDGYASLDAERDAAAAAAFKAGTLGTTDPVIAEKVAAHDAATACLDAAQRAEKVLAAALVVAQADAFAAALEDVEQRAATLRTRLLSAAALWLVSPGTTAYAMPATERMRRLITNKPANALAQADGKVTEGFRTHFRELLTDPDASLAAAD
jgi:hypothetical protein